MLLSSNGELWGYVVSILFCGLLGYFKWHKRESTNWVAKYIRETTTYMIYWMPAFIVFLIIWQIYFPDDIHTIGLEEIPGLPLNEVQVFTVVMILSHLFMVGGYYFGKYRSSEK